MIPLLWIGPAMFAAALLAEGMSTSRASDGGNEEAGPPEPKAEMGGFPTGERTSPATVRPSRNRSMTAKRRPESVPGKPIDAFVLDFNLKDRKRREEPKGCPLASVMTLPLAEATEAARLRFLKGPVASVSAGEDRIIMRTHPESTDALLVPPVYLGWPVEIQ